MSKDPAIRDAQAGSDADATPVAEGGKTPANPVDKRPAPIETEDEEQQDDNIDDKGNKPDGSKQDQPT